ncbi:histidine phosphatase family protein [Paraconexibacter antarcticus]|uniref:Histidine phosphatase family protein n=1 Tax=Paraconexibacter antarcticus TaxID=2949664 RepID=A0ABY5DV41_9ACTN|nr:histidine phosphatase family protein [Paraconexibacter antarcticus]UTI64712.1 histidine phosphatase family protein [Paraconexibacter antarcticus]
MIFLARHGETPYNAEERFQGQVAVGLTERGVQQAHELAAVAAEREWAGLYCSPLRRARQTADIVAAGIGLEPIPDDRFMEADAGTWTDRLYTEIEADDPEGWAAYHETDPDFRFPGGESLEELMERAVDGFVAVTHGGRLPALIVCHRGVIRAARSHTHIRGLETFMAWDVPNGTLEPL